MITKRSTQKNRVLSPALTPEERENQMISLAVDLAEKQLAEGTASAQVITHYLKLGTTREVLEKEKLAKENELIKAKIDAIKRQKEVEDLYLNALKAMREYGGGLNGGDDQDSDIF